MSKNTHTGNAALLTVLLFGGFVVTGVVTTILGPLLPVFISRWSLNDAQAGFFFTTQFAGSLVGVVLSSFLISTRGFRVTLIAGYILMALGIGALVSNNSSAVLLAAAIYGMAYGLVVPATNLCVAEQAGKKQSAALSLLNLAWSVGSLVCPVIVRYGVRTAKLNFLILLIAGAAALLALMALLSDSRQFPQQPKPAIATTPVIRGKETWWAAIFLALLFFIYVGTENAVSGWSAAFSKRLADSGTAVGELAPMYFWSGLLAGRLLAPAILKRVQEAKVANIGLLTATCGIAIFLRSYTRPLAMTGFVIAGAGLSMLYPIFIAWLTWAFGARSRRVAGVMFATGSIGGATLPWLVGAVSSRSGSLRAGLVVPFAGCLLMFLLAAVFRRTAHPGAPAGSPQ
ncbi:MAG TPA: MFS transporter [Candidatus Dormibacteraeota bacterium]|nr:MFS transporter [Candidatus Dormibacteraeota bacterium]